MSISYRDAGVDIDAGDTLVDQIAPLAAKTKIAEVLSGVGGFAGLCAVPSDIVDPILVSGTDGVGTKLKIAFACHDHRFVGQDLVAMCVNDVLTCGARPLFFLDYFATGKLHVTTAKSVITGIAKGCEIAHCALLGGETAEMPGMYPDGEYDLAGFAVGVVGRSQIIDGTRVSEGDAILGLPSSGVHSNGFSLVRKVLNVHRIALTSAFTELGDDPIGDILLTPTRIYSTAVAALIAEKIDVKAMSHITGGGLPGNVPRVLPEHLGAEINLASFDRTSIFSWLARLGPIDEGELRRTFNIGLGYLFVVAQENVDGAIKVLASVGEQPRVVGQVVRVPEGTDFESRVRFVGEPREVFGAAR